MFVGKENKAMEKFKQGEAALGMIISSGSPAMCEIAGYAGCDYAMICLEHTSTDLETMVNLIRAGESAGLTMFVRVPGCDPFWIQRAREAGAMGIVVPHVTCADDVRQVQDMLRLPPEGHSGLCPAARAARYDETTWEEYMRWANENISLIVLLEDSRALDNADEIFSELRPGRDGFGIGNFDIAHEGYTDSSQKVKFVNPELDKKKALILESGKRHGIMCQGIAWPTSDKAGVENALRNHTQLLLFDIDLKLFYNSVKKLVNACR